MPETRLVVVGPSPSSKLRKISNLPHISFTGYVEDPFQILSESQVIVAPIRMGSGIQNKVLEAMGLGKPVVTTSIGASGLDAIPGQHLVVADDPDGMAQSVLELFEDPRKRKRIGEAARRAASGQGPRPTGRSFRRRGGRPRRLRAAPRRDRGAGGARLAGSRREARRPRARARFECVRDRVGRENRSSFRGPGGLAKKAALVRRAPQAATEP